MLRMSLGTRLAVAFGALVVLVLATGAAAVARVRRLDRALEEASEVHSAAIQLAALGLVNAQQASRLTEEALMERDPARARALLGTLDETRSASDRVADELEALLRGDPGDGACRALRDRRIAYRQAFAPVRALIEQGEHEAALARAAEELMPPRRELNQAWAAFIDAERAAIRRGAALGAQEVARTQRDLVVAAAAAALVALGVGAGTLPRVVRTVEATARAVHALAAGDLRWPVEVTRRDELGELQGALALLSERLAWLFRAAQANADELDADAVRLTAMSRALRKATREHAEVITEAALLLPRIATRLAAGDGEAIPGEPWDAVGQLNRLMARIDEVARRNRAGADETAEEAARLAAQARALRVAFEGVLLPGAPPAVLAA